MPFTNPIVAGDGELTIPAVKSDNFVPGVSGWQITQAGDATFYTQTVQHSHVAGSESIGGSLTVGGQITANSGNPVVTTENNYPLTVAAGWQSFGPPFHQAECQILDSQTFLRGMVSNLNALNANTFYVMATLPGWTNPSATEPFLALVNGAAGRIEVRQDGTINVMSNVPVPANGFVSLSGINYSIL